MPPFKGNVTIEDYHIELIISSLIVAISNHVKLVSKLSSENQAKVYSEFLMHPQSMIKSSSTGHYKRRGSVNDIAKRYSISSPPEQETDWEHGPSHLGLAWWENFGIFFSFEDHNSTFNHWMRRRKWLQAIFNIIIVFSIVSSIYMSLFILFGCKLFSNCDCNGTWPRDPKKWHFFLNNPRVWTRGGRPSLGIET